MANINKPVAIVLGGTAPHIALIKNLQNRGYYTILVDYLDNPPAKESADEHLKVSTLDREAVLNVARSEKASLIISACLDQPIPVACYVSEKLKLPHIYDYNTSLSLTDKFLMKDVLMSNGIHTAKLFDVSDPNQIKNVDIKFPVVVKPADSTGSQGVQIAASQRNLIFMFEEARRVSLSNRVIVEEYLVGRELGIDCFVENGRAKILMVREKIKIPSQNLNDPMLLAGSITPVSISQFQKKEVEDVANKVTKAFGIKSGPLLLQGILTNNRYSIIEVAGRVGGGMNHKNILADSGIDVISEMINSWIGKKINLETTTSSGLYRAVNYVYAGKGVFSKVLGLEALFQKGYIESYFIVKPKNSILSETLSSKNQIAKFIVTAKTKKELIEKLKLIVDTIDVLGLNGNSIIEKNKNMLFYLENYK